MIVVAVGGSVVVGGSQYFFQNFFQIRITVGVELIKGAVTRRNSDVPRISSGRGLGARSLKHRWRGR